MTVTSAGPQSRLYLVVTLSPSLQPSLLLSAIGAGDVASVQLRPAAGAALQAALVQPLVRAVQQQDVAVLVENDVEIVKACGADGVHLTASPTVAADVARARAALGSTAIIGVCSSLSRHEAMELGELGVDYVAFAAEAPQEIADRQDMLGWWCEVIAVPAVALAVGEPQLATALATLGCEFIGVELDAGGDAKSEIDRIAAFQRAISRHPVPVA